ncbi:ATP-dependent RNA helicase ddx1 [Dermatophagoides pteronyssinus]|uniref:ATP-dependent RNA helicase n=1 Tax=Dermatophagoides pteronyssinus TaxID=6956 RepID=A0ABQ8J9S3_DERPT|nr:ATP-dependent RNA helicase ddx1 [Dermatophagoides pteronyssinus]
MTAFEEMGIMPEIGKALEEMDWLLPTNIQAEAIPLILGGGDVLMAAETGSGKTGAFCLPVIQIVWETLNSKSKSNKSQVSDKCLFSPYDIDPNLSLAADLLSAQSKVSNQWQGVRANKAVKKCRGKKNRFYYEVEFTSSGLARVGWALDNASRELGTDRFSWGYGGTAKKSNSRNFEDYGEKFGDKFDVIGNIIDLDYCTISWTKNGQDLGVAFQIPQNLCEQNCFFPCVCIKNAGLKATFHSDQNAPFSCTWIGQLGSDQIVNNNFSANSSTNENSPKAIILEPSRELAEQTHNCIANFKKYLSGEIRQCLLVGGLSAKDQMYQLQAGIDIVTGTIGRINELVNSGHLSLQSCRFFIIDEVDAFLAQGNMQTILQLHGRIPRMFPDGKRLQMIVCSATLHNFDVKKLAERVMFFPNWVDLKGEDSVPDTVHHVILRVDPRKDTSWMNLPNTITTDGVHQNDIRNYNNPDKETLSEAVKILKADYVIKAIDALQIDCAIVFCRTKLDCDNLEAYFNHLSTKLHKDYSCVCLHGDRTPQERQANLETFKTKNCKFLICTDVAARGIDITGVPYLLQVTLPDDKANYLHRIGRVGRAERMGLAISFVSNVPEKVWFHANCRSRGKNCWNTELVDHGGCCIWYNEIQLLADIEEHLNCIISEIGLDFKLEVNEFDGKVMYGAKQASNAGGYTYKDHVAQMATNVQQLYELESKAQLVHLGLYY